MREILFKAKRLDNGEWVEGAFCPKNGNGDIPCIIATSGIYEGCWFEIDPETVCQYTGLKDMNGKKIFEGDILCEKGFGHYYKEKKSKVALNHDWNCGCCNSVYGYFTDGDLDLGDYDVAEVIGNIFDNPELLEVEE